MTFLHRTPLHRLLLAALVFGTTSLLAAQTATLPNPPGNPTPASEIPGAHLHWVPVPKPAEAAPLPSEAPGHEPGYPPPARIHYASPAPTSPNPLPYDLLLVNGHVIDVKNHIDRVMDVAIKDGKIAAVGEHLDPSKAAKTINVAGLYVTPGLIDIHTHDFYTPGQPGAWAGDLGIEMDGFSFRNGVTTVADAGSSGWRTFEDFKNEVIDREQTRILAFINIVGAGMRGGRFEDNLADMNGDATGWMARRYPQTIIGIKSAHFKGPQWWPYIQAVKAGNIAHIPVMIDYGANRPERPLYDLLTKVLRPGDIYTHCFSGLRGEQDLTNLGPQKGLIYGRMRGIYFDVGTGGGSFRFRVAMPILHDGFLPDSISTDLHVDSMNSSTKNLLNDMSKFLAMGETLQEVVAQTTWHPAIEIQRRQLGNLSVGAPADVAVLRLEHGHFGYLDMDNTKLLGTTRLDCALTIRAGRIVYDHNGISMSRWNDTHPGVNPRLAAHWTVFRPHIPRANQVTAGATPATGATEAN